MTAGARWQQVIDAAAPLGLAPLNGSSPLVGVIGYTLGGGLSPTMGRAHGWAADHVTSLEVVTADGELRHVDAASEPDLFWALRGGKSNFGVVTAMEFALFPAARLWAGGLFYDGADAAAVLHTYAEVTADAPDELSSSIALLRLPALPVCPPSSPTGSPCTSASPASARQPRPPG
ncbi:Mitomycin radical oxidase (plasmid) [Streptomyces sp. enrichment culture]|uniref:FAD-binding oxidoreductase n=1 Tax=Streptomyces sp. enrichment culture TaxID=1795815 RepID=UPI003F551F84